MLAGLLRAPSRFAPTGDLARAQARAKIIVGLMEEQGYLTAAQADEARAHPAVLSRAAAARAGGSFADWVMSSGPDFLTRKTTEDVEVADHLRPAHPARRRGGDGGGLRDQAQARLERPGRGGGDVARRRGARDDRRARPRRRRGPVQPRDPGPAADRLALQALRLRRRAAGRRQPLRPGARRAALALHPRLGRMDAGELQPRVPRPDHPDRGAGAVGQHRHRARLRGDRTRAGARGGPGPRHERPDRRRPGAGARRLRGDAARDDRRLCRLPRPGRAHHALRPDRAPPQVRRHAADAGRPAARGCACSTRGRRASSSG